MDEAGGEQEEASRRWEEGKLEQEVNTELDLSMARPSLPDRKDKAAVLAVSRSAETVPLSTDHKLKSQRHPRLQGRRACGGRRGGTVAAGISQPEQRAKSKVKVSKSCTKECEIVKPGFSTTYPPPGAAGYSSLYAEILSQSEFDLYPHPEVTSDQESEELPPLTESTLLDSELSLTNQDVSEVSEASFALSVNADHISAEADSTIEEQCLTSARESGAERGQQAGSRVRSGHDQPLLRSSGITCSFQAVKDVKRSEVSDISTEVKDSLDQEGATRSQSLSSEVTSSVSGSPEQHDVKTRDCLRARKPPVCNETSSERSESQALLDPAVNIRPSELRAGFDMDVTSGRQCHPHRPRSRSNSPGVCTPGHVSPPGAHWALNRVLRNVELLPTPVKPAICRLQALDTGRRQPDNNASRSGQTDRGRSHSPVLPRNLSQAVGSVPHGQQKEKNGGENSMGSDLSQNQSELVTDGRSEMSGLELSDQSAFLTLDRRSLQLPRAVSPAISILSLHSLTEVKCHYSRRDHNDVIHGDLLVGSWTSDQGSARFVNRENVQVTDSVLKEREGPDGSTRGTDGPAAGPGNISSYGQHTTACVSVAQGQEEPWRSPQPEPLPDPTTVPDTDKMISYVQPQPDTRQLCTPPAQPMLHKSAQTGQGTQTSFAQAGQARQGITVQEGKATQLTTAQAGQASQVTSGQRDQAIQVTKAQTGQAARVTTAQTDQGSPLTTAHAGSGKETKREDVNSQVVPSPATPHVRSLSYLSGHSRNGKDTMGQTALPTQDYLPFLHTLRNRSLSRKFMPQLQSKSRKLDNTRRGPDEGVRNSVNSANTRGDAEDTASSSHAFPRGREIPPGWRPGLATSNPITIMSAAYSRPKHQPKKVKGRRQRRQSVPQCIRQSVRQYHAWVKRTMADSRPDKRTGQSAHTKLSRSDSSVSPETSHRKLPVRAVCSSEDEDVQEGQGRSLSKENFDFKRKYYENLRRQQGRHHCLDGQIEAPPPRTKRITSQVTLLKTLDELYRSESPDEEWTECNIGDSDRVCSPNAELLQQQMFLLKYYNGRLHRQSDETIEFLANSQETIKGIRIRRDTTSMVPSIISNERLQSLCAKVQPELTPDMANTDKTKLGQQGEQQRQSSEKQQRQSSEKQQRQSSEKQQRQSSEKQQRQSSEKQQRQSSEKQQTSSLKSTRSLLTSDFLASLTSWKNEPTIEPMAAVVRKEVVRARLGKAKATHSPFKYMLPTRSTAPQATPHVGCAERCYVGPSLPSSNTSRPLLALTSESRLPRSALDNRYYTLLAKKSKSFDKDIPRQPGARLKVLQTHEREADSSDRGKSKVRFADQPTPLSPPSQSWNRCEEDTWCDSINAMLLRANKVQEENDFMKKNKSSYPRPDSAKIVSPVVPKSATFLGELLKQDHIDRQQARTTTAKVSRRMDENLTSIILTRTQQNRITNLGADTSMDAVSRSYQGRKPAAAASPASAQPLVSSSSGNAGNTSVNPQAMPLSTSRSDQRYGASNGVRSAGVLQIQVQMSHRATDRMWKTHEKLRKERSSLGAGAAVFSPDKNLRPKKLAPLRISKPMDFVNPDARHLRRNPIREIKDANHTGQPRSSSDLFLPISEPAVKAQENTETNYLLDRYSDTFHYYKNQYTGKHKPAIVQMFSDSFEKDSNNNARYHQSTHGSQETTHSAHSSDNDLHFSQSLRDRSTNLCISDTYQYRVSGTGIQQSQVKIGSNSSSSSPAIPAAENCPRFNPRISPSENDEEKNSYKLTQTDDTVIDYVVSYNHYAGGRHDPCPDSPCTKVDTRTWRSERLELNQSQPSQVRLDNRNNTPEIMRSPPARDSEDRQKDRGLISTLDHQLFVKAVLDYSAVQPRNPTTAQQPDNNELLQHYACEADQAYRSSVLSNTDLSPNLGGSSHLWVPNNHPMPQVAEVGQTEMNIGHRKEHYMNSSHEMTSEESMPHQPASSRPQSSQAKSESATQVAQSDSSLYNPDHPATFADHTQPLVSQDAQSPGTTSENPQQTVFPAQTHSWHLDDDTDLVSSRDIMSVTGQPVKLAVKTSTSESCSSKSPSCTLGNSKLFSHRVQRVKLSKDRGQNQSSHVDDMPRQKPPGPAKTLTERKPVDMHIKNMKMSRQRPAKTTSSSSNTKAQDKRTQQTASAKKSGPLHVTFEGPPPDQSGSNRGEMDVGRLDTGQSYCGTQILHHRRQDDVNFHWEEIKVPPPFKKNWDPLKDFSEQEQQHQERQQQQQQQQRQWQDSQGQQQNDLWSVQQRGSLMAEPAMNDACPSQYSSSSTSLHMANVSPVTDSMVECQGTHNSNTMEIREDLKADSSPRAVSQINTALRAEVNDQENTISEVSDELEGEINPCKTPWNSLMLESGLATVGTPPHSILSPVTFKMDTTRGVAPPPTARTQEMTSEHSSSSTTCTDSPDLSPLRPTIDRQFLKRLRGPDIVQAVGGDSDRLMEGLHAVTRYRCYIPVFQLRSLEPAEFSPLVLQVNHCASVYDNYQRSRKRAKFHSWIVFYTEDASSYVHSIHTVQWLPTGLFTLHPSQADSSEDPGFGQEVKAARLLHYSYEGSDLAFTSDQVYLFGREMQTRERALAVLVSLHDQLRDQPATQYFAHLCGWIPPLLYSRTVRLPPIHQPRLKDTVEVRQAPWSRAGQGQSVGQSVVTELYLPEVKMREVVNSQPEPAPEAVPRLPAIRCLPCQSQSESAPASNATFLCLRCGTLMAGQPEPLTTAAQPRRPLSTVNLASLGPSGQTHVQLSRPHTAINSFPKATTDSWEVTGKGLALPRQTHSVLGRPTSPTGHIIRAGVTEFPEDAQAAAADRKSNSMTLVTDLEQLTESSLPPRPTTSSLPHQRRKEWWEKNRHKLLMQRSQQHSQQTGQTEVAMTPQPQATSQSRTGPDRQSGNSTLYTPQLSPQPPRSNMTGWGWTPAAEMEDEERSLLVIATWNTPIIPPPFSEGQDQPAGQGEPTKPPVKTMKSTHKTEYKRHRRNLSHISQSYKSPYWTKKEVKCRRCQISDSSDECPSPSPSSSSSSSQTDSGSESASDDSVPGSVSSAAGSDFFTRYANKGGPTSIDDIIHRTLPRHQPPHNLHLLKKVKERDEMTQLGYLKDLETVSSGSEHREPTEKSERSVTFALSEYDMCSDAEEVKELWKVCFPEVNFWDRRRKKKLTKPKIWA